MEKQLRKTQYYWMEGGVSISSSLTLSFFGSFVLAQAVVTLLEEDGKGGGGSPHPEALGLKKQVGAGFSNHNIDQDGALVEPRLQDYFPERMDGVKKGGCPFRNSCCSCSFSVEICGQGGRLPKQTAWGAELCPSTQVPSGAPCRGQNSVQPKRNLQGFYEGQRQMQVGQIPATLWGGGGSIAGWPSLAPHLVCLVHFSLGFQGDGKSQVQDSTDAAPRGVSPAPPGP